MKKKLACIMMTSVMLTCLSGSSIPVLAEEINEDVITEDIFTTPDMVSEEVDEDLETHGEEESNGVGIILHGVWMIPVYLQFPEQVR